MILLSCQTLAEFIGKVFDALSIFSVWFYPGFALECIEVGETLAL